MYEYVTLDLQASFGYTTTIDFHLIKTIYNSVFLENHFCIWL